MQICFTVGQSGVKIIYHFKNKGRSSSTETKNRSHLSRFKYFHSDRAFSNFKKKSSCFENTFLKLSCLKLSKSILGFEKEHSLLLLLLRVNRS